ncbi:MAG: hypothetical protein ABIF89_02085 [bacterium]
MKKFIVQRLKVVQNREVMLLISSSKETTLITQTSAMAMARLKRLRVIIRIGRVIVFRIGATKKFSRPHKIPIKIKLPIIWPASAGDPGMMKKGPLKLTPSMNVSANQNPSTPETKLRNNFHNIYNYASKECFGGQLRKETSRQNSGGKIY